MNTIEFNTIGDSVRCVIQTGTAGACHHRQGFEPLPLDCFADGERLASCCDCGQTMTERIARLCIDGMERP